MITNQYQFLSFVHRNQNFWHQCLSSFINDYKIYKAVEMFRQGATNVETVRMKCGFNDAKNFRNIFKRKKGVTPKQFVQDLYK